MTLAVELKMQRRQTDAFIAANPLQIVLDRKAAPVKDDTGGYVEADVADPAAQTMRLVRAGLEDTTESPTVGGVGVRTTDVLVAQWNADIKVNDGFTLDGEPYVVTEISDTPYRKVASVVLRGHRG